jgi:hypothetical protein
MVAALGSYINNTRIVLQQFIARSQERYDLSLDGTFR